MAAAYMDPHINASGDDDRTRYLPLVGLYKIYSIVFAVIVILNLLYIYIYIKRARRRSYDAVATTAVSVISYRLLLFTARCIICTADY